MSDRVRAAGPPVEPASAHDELVDALLSASRVMVGLAARSLADLDSDVTLPQYRALVVLASRGPQRVVDISAELGVNSSTGTRMCERLVRKGLVRRERSDTDRREVRLTLTASGEYLVQEVTRRRRSRAGPDRRHRPRGLARAAHHGAAVARGHRGRAAGQRVVARLAQHRPRPAGRLIDPALVAARPAGGLVSPAGPDRRYPGKPASRSIAASSSSCSLVEVSASGSRAGRVPAV